ncbi:MULTISPECIES: ABC transporter ATP-binding protein [Bacillota]|jgi:putative tryptophan/tyrosine transport system ATP-binding protein|uniref:ATP-binding cassette domain-containing protein n=2 Tax=Amedibacillus TaxID=2749846 RepID=A0A7G9GP83_9FIRM|nr:MULTISPECIES: ATP-binding cassette domain-containing protein [Bacillota]QNM12615.1 ATP-binding cassette domain-containing protein [[Eubacterium] hominis]MCH4284070.1 ATP-binding cassette domain-containing protein [Amedibacillus hominis]RGB57671.1 ATP-binding cassette domain-containing protein [Absiella sp. AM22-9]RGB62223.1 ATP-binding cassette domain-containing protein [Absiella sp. AM10-20]RGB65498.1 ATP-binding cassette domain-containing protein [Absiella sp. AM09-45]
MLDLKDLCLTFYPGTVNEKVALDHVSFHVEEGDFISVLGTNGAGKSTLLNVISGSLPNDSGSIILDGEDISSFPEYKRAKKIGRLFQDPLKGTAPNMTIEENLGLAYSRGKRTTLSRAIKKGDRSFFIEKLKELNLGLEERITTNVGLLSGGQRQALTLLMATIVTPKLLLLDEHTAALDPKTATQVMEITDKIVKEHNITTLMITHNMRQALEYGNKTIILNEGKIVKVLEGEERKSTTVEDLLQMYDFI